MTLLEGSSGGGGGKKHDNDPLRKMCGGIQAALRMTFRSEKTNAATCSRKGEEREVIILACISSSHHPPYMYGRVPPSVMNPPSHQSLMVCVNPVRKGPDIIMQVRSWPTSVGSFQT